MKVIPLSSKHSSSAAWSAEQCVSDLLDHIKRGEVTPIKMVIAAIEEGENGGWSLAEWFLNVNPMEEIALLELLKKRAMDRWEEGR